MDSPFEKKSLFQRTNSDQLFKKKKMNHFYKKRQHLQKSNLFQ
jgi:hypothetical protein